MPIEARTETIRIGRLGQAGQHPGQEREGGRLEAEGGRKTRDERRAHFHARKDAQTAARTELAQERDAGHWSSVADEE